MSLQSILQSRLAAALAGVGIDPDFAVVTLAADTRFGDYQTNAAMVAAKGLKKNPREVAMAIVSHLEVADLSETPQIAGQDLSILGFSIPPLPIRSMPCVLMNASASLLWRDHRRS